jgi:hypothetical protein
MSIQLESESGFYLYMNLQTWSHLLLKAIDYGWKPVGTEAPGWLDSSREWDGNYSWNCGQSVTAADARSLSDALVRMLLDDTTDEISEEEDVFGLRFEQIPGSKDNFFLFDFAMFCREGYFWID